MYEGEEYANKYYEKFENKDILNYSEASNEFHHCVEINDFQTQEFQDACSKLLEGSVQEKIWAYSYFIETNVLPNIDNIYEIANEDLRNSDVLLISQAFIFLAKFFQEHQMEAISTLFHSSRNDDEYIVSLINVLKQNFYILFPKISDLLNIDKFNTLRLITARITKLCMNCHEAINDASCLLSIIIDFFNHTSGECFDQISDNQKQLIEEFIKYEDMDFYMNFYEESEQLDNISNLLKIICLSQPDLIKIPNMIDWINSVFFQSNSISKRNFAFILSFFCSNEENTLHIISLFDEFIINEISSGVLKDRISAAIFFSGIAKFSEIIEVHSFLSNVIFGDFILEIKDTDFDIELMHVFLEGFQYIFKDPALPKFIDYDIEDAKNEFFNLVQDLELKEKESPKESQDFYILQLMEFKHVPTHEFALDILSLIEDEIDNNEI